MKPYSLTLAYEVRYISPMFDLQGSNRQYDRSELGEHLEPQNRHVPYSNHRGRVQIAYAYASPLKVLSDP